METTLSWEVVKDFYQREFGIDEWVVEMYANMDILILCASGASNLSIERLLEIPVEEVVKVIETTFDFRGWEKDLPINPYRMFCSYDGEKSSLAHFQGFVESVVVEMGKYGITKDYSSVKLFYLCETMYDIEERIKDEWI